jgi:hypothetical protein
VKTIILPDTERIARERRIRKLSKLVGSSRNAIYRVKGELSTVKGNVGIVY